MSKTIAILGGGNGGHTLAADLSLQGHSIRLFEMAKFRHQMEDVFQTRTIRAVGAVFSGTAEIDRVTSDIDEAIAGAELIFVAVPAFAHADYARLLAPRVKGNQLIVLLPGTFGTLEFAAIFRGCGADPNVVLAETDTLPYATRLVKPGTVKAHGRTTVRLGVLPSGKTDWACGQLQGVLAFEPAANVLEVGFSSLNPIIHPPGTILNAGRIERSRGEFYIYEEGMTPSVVHVMELLDAERRAVAGAFGLTLPPINEAIYESGYGPKGTTWEALNGSTSLTPIKGPSDLKSRYLSEDIPYGLVTFASIAAQIGVETPIMNSLVHLGFALIRRRPEDGSRNADTLGIRGMDVNQLLQAVTDGYART
ncbi:MAG: NAD/NADP octopine/nopaline dehydrogenase family protein [Paenibacillaceae bacterium]|nr:NAD/NADP octopine/nopaline dehydrogenase family protein [Paenibacillaceae bacterium]